MPLVIEGKESQTGIQEDNGRVLQQGQDTRLTGKGDSTAREQGV